MLYKFNQFLGEEKLIEKLKWGFSFGKIAKDLSGRQKEELFSEGLNYAYSIDDKETLLNLL